jgi:SSS family solute:Na+ symporter
LQGASADQVFGRVLREIQNHSSLGYGLVVITLSAVLAAMMSTADSALLSISSMLTKDICATYTMRGASEAQLTRVGKIFSWSIIVVLIALAVLLREKSTLVQLMDRKLDLLIQLVPAFILGIRWRGLRAQAVLAGLVIGVGLALMLAFGDFPVTTNGKVYGFHPGLVALLPNIFIAVVGSLFLNRSDPRQGFASVA